MSKRKRLDSMNTVCSDTSQITDFQDESPTRKRYKRNNDNEIKEENNKDGVTKKNRASLKKDNSNERSKITQNSEPDAVIIPPYVPILDNENILPSRTRSGLHSDANSDIVSKVSSDKSDKSDISDPFSIEVQRSLYRRNNLFRGVSKEKVCQYCFQPDMVFKCTKSGCNGLYHVNCSVNVMSGEEYNKRKHKSEYFKYFIVYILQTLY